MLSSTACPDYPGKSRFAGKSLLQTLFFILLVTQIGFAQWIPIGLEYESIKDIAAYNSLIFAVSSDSGKLYRSTDNGVNWSTIFELGVKDIDISPSGDLFMVKDSIYNSGPPQLFLSSDSGNTWFYLNVMEQIAPHFDNNVSGPYNVSISPTGMIFCMHHWWARGGGGTAIALSMDNGTTWLSTLSRFGGLVYDFRDNLVLTIGDAWETGGSSGRTICLSEDGGFQWTCWYWSNGGGGTYGPSGAISLCSNGNILAGVSVYGSGIVLSLDTCMSWIQVSTIIPDAGLSIASGGWLVGNDSLGVFLFSDNGDSLGSRNDGLTNLNIYTLTIDNNDYVYAGTKNGIWRRPLSEITSVEEEQINEMPTEFLLSQNYPNPFNPSTNIQYAVSSLPDGKAGSQFVLLKVYDVLGNEIETLVSEEKPAGTYEIKWYAENLPSGVYFYQMQAGSFIQTRKMLLLK